MKKPTTFERTVRLPVPAPQAFSWHEQTGALERLIPPWEQVAVVRREGGIENEAEVERVAKVGPLRKKWLARHFGYQPPHRFRDRQVLGPFAFWEDTHSFAPHQGDGRK